MTTWSISKTSAEQTKPDSPWSYLHEVQDEKKLIYRHRNQTSDYLWREDVGVLTRREQEGTFPSSRNVHLLPLHLHLGGSYTGALTLWKFTKVYRMQDLCVPLNIICNSAVLLKWGNTWGSETLRNLVQVTQLLSGWDSLIQLRPQTQVCWISKSKAWSTQEIYGTCNC